MMMLIRDDAIVFIEERQCYGVAHFAPQYTLRILSFGRLCITWKRFYVFGERADEKFLSATLGLYELSWSTKDLNKETWLLYGAGVSMKLKNTYCRHRTVPLGPADFYAWL